MCAAGWARPYKGLPGVVFQPVGMRLFSSNQNCVAISFPISIFADQSEWRFWPIRDSAFWANQIVRFGVLICMRQTHQGPGLGTPVYVSQLPAGAERSFLSPWEGEGSISLAGAERQKAKHQRCLTRVERSRTEWSSQRGLAPRPPRPGAAEQPSWAKLHDWAVKPRDCPPRALPRSGADCTASSFFAAVWSGFSVGIKLAPMTTDWHLSREKTFTFSVA